MLSSICSYYLHCSFPLVPPNLHPSTHLSTHPWTHHHIGSSFTALAATGQLRMPSLMNSTVFSGFSVENFRAFHWKDMKRSGFTKKHHPSKFGDTISKNYLVMLKMSQINGFWDISRIQHGILRNLAFNLGFNSSAAAFHLRSLWIWSKVSSWLRSDGWWVEGFWTENEISRKGPKVVWIGPNMAASSRVLVGWSSKAFCELLCFRDCPRLLYLSCWCY